MLYTDDELIGTDGATRARIIERFRESSQIIYTTNLTTRAQLVSDIASWFTPSSTNPLFVYRGSAPEHAKVEVTTNGSTWTTVNVGADSGWVAPSTLNASWDANSATVRSRLIGNRVYLRGLFRPDSGDMSVGTHGSLATLPTGHRPPSGSTYHFPVATWVNGGTPPERASTSISITDAGVISGYASETTTGFWVDGITFLND